MLRLFLTTGRISVKRQKIQTGKPPIADLQGAGLWKTWLALMVVGIVLAGSTHDLVARERDTAPYGEGLIVNVPFPESEVAAVVREVVQNGIIRGTKEYNKDEYITGATAQTSVRVFPAWTEGGEVFYKVRLHALDPRNFKNSGDVGTLAVRYVVQAQGEKNTVLRINAVFVEDFRHAVHVSNGSVEGEEYKDIHDRLDANAVMKTQAAEAVRERQEQVPRRAPSPEAAGPPNSVPAPTGVENRDTPPQATATAQVDPQTLEEHVRDLRNQVERLVKPPGAALKSAPFHTASTLQSLPAGTEVLVVITTPYWLGIETHDGQHGWMLRDDLELVP
jgi:hypothetical protein